MGWPKKKDIYPGIDPRVADYRVGVNETIDAMTAEINKRAAVEEIEKVIDEYLDNQSNADMNWRHCLAAAIRTHLVGDLED